MGIRGYRLIDMEKRALIRARGIRHHRANTGLKSVRENCSFAPPGLAHFPLTPTAFAVGCILAPPRG